MQGYFPKTSNARSLLKANTEEEERLLFELYSEIHAMQKDISAYKSVSFFCNRTYYVGENTWEYPLCVVVLTSQTFPYTCIVSIVYIFT